jgi:sugar phosphate isomerase/epimerase
VNIYISKSSIKKSIQQEDITLIDLPNFVRKQGFEGIEISDRDVLISKTYLKQFFQTCSQNNLGVIIDINVDLTLPKEDDRRQEINHAKEVINVASNNGVKYIRICLGGQSISIQKVVRRLHKFFPAKEQIPSSRTSSRNENTKFFFMDHVIRLSHHIRRKTKSKIQNLGGKSANAIDSLRQIVSELDKYKIKMGIENHWGISSRPETIMKIVKEINHPNVGTCPDFGNFSIDVDALEGLELLVPKAVIVHAKCYGFNKNLEDREVDFCGCLKILKKYKFKGPVTVEYEGVDNCWENCSIARQLIEKYL